MLIDDLRILVADTDNWARNSETESRLRDLVNAYDALQPDWSSAPEWAHWYAVDAGGEACWYDNRPRWFNILWSKNQYSDITQRVEERVELPLGIDARLCLWAREQEANDDG